MFYREKRIKKHKEYHKTNFSLNLRHRMAFVRYCLTFLVCRTCSMSASVHYAFAIEDKKVCLKRTFGFTWLSIYVDMNLKLNPQPKCSTNIIESITQSCVMKSHRVLNKIGRKALQNEFDVWYDVTKRKQNGTPATMQ